MGSNPNTEFEPIGLKLTVHTKGEGGADDSLRDLDLTFRCGNIACSASARISVLNLCCSLSTTAFCAAGRALISSASRFKFENFSQWPLATTHSTAGSSVIAPFAADVIDLSHGF
jgi:hypothetical protein